MEYFSQTILAITDPLCVATLAMHESYICLTHSKQAARQKDPDWPWCIRFHQSYSDVQPDPA